MRGSDRQQGTDCRLEAESVSSELTRSFINLFFNSSVQSLCQPYLNHSRHLEIYYQCGQPMHSLYIQGESVTPDIVTINTDFLSAMCHPSTLRRGPRVFTLTESNYRQQIHFTLESYEYGNKTVQHGNVIKFVAHLFLFS